MKGTGAEPSPEVTHRRPFSGWDDVFETLADAADIEPVTLILDEFPELMNVSEKPQAVTRSPASRWC